jgi:Transposase and inactivated derivatives, IS30 family
MHTKSHYNKHLTYADRLKIEALHRQKHTKQEIAEAIGVSYITVYRELKRGACTLLDWEYRYYDTYSADVAQQDYDRKSRNKGRPDKLGNNHHFATFIEKCISKNKYSVDAALYAAKQENIPFTVSRTTLYRYIDLGYLAVDNRHLPQGKRKKSKRPQRQAARSAYRSIEQRNISRNDVGHWEMDTVVGKAKGKSSALLVLTERKSRQELIFKLPTKTASNTVRTIDHLTRKLGHHFPTIFKTITMDNGSEFADAKGIEFYKDKQRTTIFYCHPYASYERGSNENANKLIRRHIPKGQSMARVSRTKAKEIQHWINHYPRPMFKGKYSNDIFFESPLQEGIPITPALLDLFP